MNTVISFIIVLSILVFIHELGHFLFAKRAGILVREFAIGFGPKVISVKRGETAYSVRMFPLGGFVRMAGEDGETTEIKPGTTVYVTRDSGQRVNHIYLYEPTQSRSYVLGEVVAADLEDQLFLVLKDEADKETTYTLNPQAEIHPNLKTQIQIAPRNRQFGSKTAGQKAMVIFAGPLFNFLFTILLFGMFAYRTGVDEQLVIRKVTPGSPAEQIGIRSGDVIQAIDGKKIENVYIDKLTFLQHQFMKSNGQGIEIVVQRDRENRTFFVKPKKINDRYRVGIDFYEPKEATLASSLIDGCKKTYGWSLMIMDGLRQLITGNLPLSSLGGPIQIWNFTGKEAQKGIDPLVRWMALLSLNLGIFNLLPIPALDGSRLIFVGIEVLRGRPISPSREGFVHVIGFALLMILMIFVTFNDIKNIFHL